MKTQYRLIHFYVLAMLLPATGARARYTFGTETTSTNTAGITYNSGTGEFNYTDAANTSDDKASLPLTGATTNFITSTNAWHASLTINVSSKSSTATSQLSPQDGIGLSAFHLNGVTEYYASIISGQVNNTGNADPDFPPHIYGTGAHFLARIGNANETTTPLGDSVLENGDSILTVTGVTNASAATETLGAITGVLSLSYDPSTKTLTGYRNGKPVGSYSIAGWGTNPTLTLYVFGASGESLDVPTGTDTATNFDAGPGTFSIPQLTGIQSGAHYLLMWPTNATVFILQSTSDLTSNPVWTTVSPSPAIVSGKFTVTNAISGTQKFFRLSL